MEVGKENPGIRETTMTRKNPWESRLCVGLLGVVMPCFGAALNEWTFELDPAGQTLSVATNLGSAHALFPAGGDGTVATDGMGGLLCTGTPGVGGMWSSGTVLDAATPHPASGVQYLRYDFSYDLSDARYEDGTVLGMAFVDEAGTQVAGVFFHDEDAAPDPGGSSAIQMAGELDLVGTVSVILRIDTAAGELDAWYDLTGSNSFSETNPDLAGVPVTLASVGKLRFHATGDFRPAGSDNHTTFDNIRTAATWEEIAAPLAETRLFAHPLFRDHMVLQRDRSVPVWGQAAPGAAVAIHMDGAEAAVTVTDANGWWRTSIGPHPQDGGLPHSLRISSPGERDVLIQDVLFGEVYIASGQSNMYRPMSNGTTDYAAEVAAANYPYIRQLQVELAAASTAQKEPVLRYGWTPCSPATVPDFSAAGYFFARRVHLATEIPVGIILCAWGGQKIDRFLNPGGVAAIPELSGLRQYQEAGKITNLYDVFNAMVAPLIPYAMRGAIWYQGESNSTEGDLYRLKMQALVRGWRQAWGQGDFPFYYVQLSTWESGIDYPLLRDAQLRFLAEPHTGMAVAVDTGADDPSNIHPPNKQDPGYRLAQWTLARDFGQDTPYSGPLYHRTAVESSLIRVLFDHAESGLMAARKPGTNPPVPVDDPLQNFEVAGADGIFVPATAMIDADTVLVSSPSVAAPVHVRYCHASVPSGSNLLYNCAGLPASPFHTDGIYRLDVLSGSGGTTQLAAGTQRPIAATAPVAGQVFDRWIGAAAEVANLNASSTTVTMPGHALYLLATYRNTADPAYALAVNSGFGSGNSQPGSILNIAAATPATGFVFDRWTGDTQHLADPYAPRTTLRMPASPAAVTATYRIFDSVGDGIPDDWRSQHFGDDGTTTNGLSAAGADADGDGESNLREYLAGTDPRAEDSVFTFGLPRVADNKLLLDFPSVQGHRYRIETAGGLTEEWMPLYYNIAGDGTRKNMASDLGSEPRRFYRIKTTGPETGNDSNGE